MSQEITDAQAGLDIREAVGNLIERHGRKWLRFVRRMVRNPADAEDVLQEAVRKVLARGRGFHTQEQVRMYLSRAVGNMAIDFYHRRRRECLRELPLHEHRIACVDARNPHDCLEERERAAERARAVELLAEGLGRLPPKQYEALCLTVLDPEGASIREAGTENGIPYSTLRHRSMKGIRRLRTFLHHAARTSRLRLVLA